MAELFPYSRLPKDEWPERCSDASVLAGAAPVPIIAEELLRERIGGANVCDKRRALSWYKSQYPGVDFSREWRCAAGVGPHCCCPRASLTGVGIVRRARWQAWKRKRTRGGVTCGSLRRTLSGEATA